MSAKNKVLKKKAGEKTMDFGTFIKKNFGSDPSVHRDSAAYEKHATELFNKVRKFKKFK